MELEIKCPDCGTCSRTGWDRIPAGKLKTTCNGCSHQFTLDKAIGLNCRPLKVEKHEGPVFANEGWRVEHPACQGMTYDLEAVEGLIRSGMANAETRVCPPGHTSFLKTAEVSQLKKALEQWASKNARSSKG